MKKIEPLLDSTQIKPTQPAVQPNRRTILIQCTDVVTWLLTYSG